MEKPQENWGWVDWVGYEEELTEKVKQLPVRLSMGCEIEHCADTLRECIVSSKAELQVSVVRRKVMARSGGLRSSQL